MTFNEFIEKLRASVEAFREVEENEGVIPDEDIDPGDVLEEFQIFSEERILQEAEEIDFPEV